MKPTSDILERINQCSCKHTDGVFTRLFRYLLREDVYYMAYQKLYSNKGALTKGTNNITADGFGDEFVANIISDLRNGSYVPTPLKRVYIPKRNGKMRPLSIPSFRDKLLQEVIRMFLEAIYEPTFDDWSHGFRPHRSCHTALKQMANNFKGVPWFIEGDIHACFDCIDHVILMNILARKIKDSKFLNIIRAFLKTGYFENWTYNKTYSGTPQGGICSPILANIYLSELDAKVRVISERMSAMNNTVRPVRNKEYHAVEKKCAVLSKKISSLPFGEDRDCAITQLKNMRKYLRTIPYSANIDKGLSYVRYADDWLIGVKGSKAECDSIKLEIKEFLRSTLKLELSDEKTLITHSSGKIRFLGYDITVRRSNIVRGFKDSSGRWRKQRTLNKQVALFTPIQDRIMKFLFNKKVIKQTDDGKIIPIHRPELINKPDVEIVNSYNAEIRGLLNFYCLSANYNSLSYFVHLMEVSCLKTLAAKHKCSTKAIRNKYRDGHNWSIPCGPSKRSTRKGIVTLKDHRKKFYSDNIHEYHFYGYKSTLWKRIQNGVCELCHTRSEVKPVVHLVRKLKDLGNQPWELIMKDLRRKTLIVCPSCHNFIHAIG